MAVLTLLVSAVACSQPDEAVTSSRPRESASPSASNGAAAAALSGASGPGVTSGAFGTWRGEPVAVAGTWSDNDADSLQFWQLQPGGDYATWDKPLDIAVGAFDDGGSWKSAAAGDYDARWTTSLEKLAGYRSAATGTTYIRFAHEMNGDWYPWRVNTSNYRDFETAWKRYRALQQKIFPEAKLVFCLNRESSGANMDWRGFFPGADEVDVLAVDYYNQYPTVTTTAEWDASLDDVDAYGAPKGLARYRSFAASVGLPLAVPEWSGSARSGDEPAFVDGFLGYVRAHGGEGAGQVEYEILFDVDQDENNWNLYGDGGRMPESAAAYRRFFR
jgi:hypothetical protein